MKAWSDLENIDWKTQVRTSKSPPAHCVPSRSALSFRFAFAKRRRGFLQMLQHLLGVLRKSPSSLHSLAGYLLFLFFAAAADVSSLLSGSDFFFCPCHFILHTRGFLHWACPGVFPREHPLSQRLQVLPLLLFSLAKGAQCTAQATGRQTQCCVLQLSLQFH